MGSWTYDKDFRFPRQPGKRISRLRCGGAMRGRDVLNGGDERG